MELKRCPFCGSEAIIEPYQVRKGYEATVHCNKCPASMTTITFDTQEDAENAVKMAWNKRDDHTAQEEITKLQAERDEALWKATWYAAHIEDADRSKSYWQTHYRKLLQERDAYKEGLESFADEDSWYIHGDDYIYCWDCDGDPVTYANDILSQYRDTTK